MERPRKVHLIGAGGIGMSGVAQLLLARRAQVHGCDLSLGNSLIKRVASLGGKIHLGHNASCLNHPDLVVYSSSIDPGNPELVAARNRGIPVLHRGQMLAQLLAGRKTIAVTGCHGKSTTTAMAGELLVAAGLDPTVVVGAEVESFGGNVRTGRGRFAVVEADESDGSLLWLTPSVLILTNLDEDHLDYFRNRGELLETIQHLGNRLDPQGLFIGCADEPWVRRIFPILKGGIAGGRAAGWHAAGRGAAGGGAKGRRRILYGLSQEAQVRAEGIELFPGRSRYVCLYRGKRLGAIRLQVPGIHNVLNSLAVVSLSLGMGIPFQTVTSSLSGFKAAKRRFQIQGEVDGVIVVEDYAHHPAEIESTLAAARTWPNRRIVCVFQPHRYTRTRWLGHRWAASFLQADEVILLPIYAASEEPIDGVTSDRIAQELTEHGKRKVSLLSAEEALKRLTDQARSGDLILFLGAGDVGSLAPRLVEALRSRSHVHGF